MKNIIYLFTAQLLNIFSINSQVLNDNIRIQIPFGHTGDILGSTINEFKINPEGSKLVTVGFDKKVIVWDIEHEKELFNCIGHTDNVASVDYSSDNSKIVTSSWDKTVKIWDAQNGQLLQTLIGHREHPNKVMFFKGNKNRILSVCNSRGANEVFIWDLLTGKKIFEFEGGIALLNKKEDILFVADNSENYVCSYSLLTGMKLKEYQGLSKTDAQYGGRSVIYSIAIDNSERNLIAASGDGTPIVWDIKSGQQKYKLEGHKGWVPLTGFSANGKYIFTKGDNDGTVKIWNSRNGKMLFSYKDSLSSAVQSAIFSNDDNYFSFIHGNSLKTIKLNGFKLINDVPLHVSYNSKMLPTGNPRIFAVSCENSVKFFDFENCQLQKEFKGRTNQSSLSLFNNTHYQSSLEGYIAGNNFMFKIDNPQTMRLFKDTLLLISPEGNVGWFLKNNSEIQEVDLSSLNVLNSIKLVDSLDLSTGQNSIKLQLSKKYLFLEYNKSIFILNRINYELVHKISGQNLVLSNDIEIIGLTADHMINDINDLEENSILIFQINTKDTLFYKKQNDYITQLSFSSDSKYLISCSIIGVYDGYAVVYDIPNKMILDTIGYEIPTAKFTNFPNQVLFTQALNFDDRNNSKTTIRDFIKHEDYGFMEGDNPQFDWKKNFISTTLNDTILIYRENDFSQINSLKGHKDRVSNILFNSQLKKLVSTSFDNQLIVWDTDKSCQIYKLVFLENDNWIVQVPNSPYYMSSKDAYKLLNFVSSDNEQVNVESLDAKYNRPDIVLKSIEAYFKK
jgi:WD40 repeat protein